MLLERIRTEKAKLVKEKKIKKDKNESIIYRGDDNSYYEKFIATGEVKCIDDEIPFEIPRGGNGHELATSLIIQVESSKVVVIRMAEHHRNLLQHPIYIGDISSLIM